MTTTLVSDTFTRADGAVGATESGQPWTGTGTWVINNGQLVNTAAGTLLVESGASDCTVSSVMLDASANWSSSVCWRASDANNFLAVFPGGLSIHKCVAGVFTQIGSISANGPGTYSVTAASNSHTVFKDGTPIGSVTDSFNATATMHGMGSINVPSTERWDTFTITTPAALDIAPNDPNILYSPFNWDVSDTVAVTISAGAYFRVMVTGSVTRLILNFDVSPTVYNAAQVRYRVDDGPWTTATVAAALLLTMPTSTTSWPDHVLDVVVKSVTALQERWATPAGQLRFQGISTSPHGVTTVPAQCRSLSVLVYGDSITAGWFTTHGQGWSPELDASDSQQCYSLLLADALGAEVGVVGFLGQGWVASGISGAPSFADSWMSLRSGVPRTGLTTTPPDLIVINHGTNDNTDITATVTTVLNAILATVPTATRVAIVEPFFGFFGSQLQTGIAACDKPQRVAYVDTTGWWSPADSSDGLHPWGYAHQSLARRLAPMLRGVLRRGSGYLNVGGNAKPITATMA